MTLKPDQQANGKRRMRPTKQACGRLQRMSSRKQLRLRSLPHSAYLEHLSAACFVCTALVICSLSFRPSASLARPSLFFRSLFGRLLRLHGPRVAPCFALVLSFRSRSLVSSLFSLCALVLALRSRSLVSLLFSRFALVFSFRSLFSFRSPSLVPLSPLVVHLGSLGSILEPLGSLLRTKMANFRSQNGSPGAFLEALGASWALLGRSWRDVQKKTENAPPK